MELPHAPRDMSAEGFRLSPQQSHLWTLHGSGAGACHPYRTVSRVSIRGHLDDGALERALELVVQKYEILRTTFTRSPGADAPLLPGTRSRSSPAFPVFSASTA